MNEEALIVCICLSHTQSIVVVDVVVVVVINVGLNVQLSVKQKFIYVYMYKNGVYMLNILTIFEMTTMAKHSFADNNGQDEWFQAQNVLTYRVLSESWAKLNQIELKMNLLFSAIRPPRFRLHHEVQM